MSARASTSRHAAVLEDSVPAALPTIFVGLRLGLIFALINIVGVEFLINFGGLGQLISELAERYDLPGTYAAICFVILVSICVFILMEKARAMAETGRLSLPAARGAAAAAAPGDDAAHRHHRGGGGDLGGGLRVGPALPRRRAFAHRHRQGALRHAERSTFYFHLYTTFYEIGIAMVIGGLSGLAVGILLGGSKFLSRAYEAYLYYLGPCPKIIFFPIMIMWFEVGPGSKVAMGAISCFFPVALNVAGGMREIDKVLIRVGKSFRANTWQMVTRSTCRPCAIP